MRVIITWGIHWLSVRENLYLLYNWSISDWLFISNRNLINGITFWSFPSKISQNISSVCLHWMGTGPFHELLQELLYSQNLCVFFTITLCWLWVGCTVLVSWYVKVLFWFGLFPALWMAVWEWTNCCKYTYVYISFAHMYASVMLSIVGK